MKTIAILLSVLCCMSTSAQDTFSIVALDSITGEVGSAGASCVDLAFFPGFDDDFLGELFPGVGAINTQAWYIPANQANARDRMNMGESPQAIINWVVENDVQSNPSLRQYGIVAFTKAGPESAGYTGVNTDDYKNHILGPNYAIQGNILLGQEILDDMESNFLAAEGDLSCKLMAALQGANVVGADTRCASNGTSSLFAFLKVAQPNDTFGNPSLVYSVSTSDGDGVEPIDALQVIFDAEISCTASSLDEELLELISIYPNPTAGEVRIQVEEGSLGARWELVDMQGKVFEQGMLSNQIGGIELSLEVPSGVYFFRLITDTGIATSRVVME
jgi:uncharacterized Ntn-hydrolase superfamily protein